MAFDVRSYDASRDLDHVLRMWKEIRWADPSDGKDDEVVETFFSYGDTEVALIEGAAECAVHRTPGTIQFDQTELRLAAVTAVTTSRVARRSGLASQLTGRALAAAVDEGYEVAALGIFDQGFYDRHGFGSGPYDIRLSFDPSSLRIDVPYRNPVRLGSDDWEEMHAVRLAQPKRHGGISLLPALSTKVDLAWTDDPMLALGFRDDSGQLTHLVAGECSAEENGPWKIGLYAWQSPQQLLELLGLIAEQGDQIDRVEMMEPPGIQLQDLLDRPFRTMRIVSDVNVEAWAWWQFRVLDLKACVGAFRSSGSDLLFNLRLTDPIAELRDTPWEGIGGDYTVAIGDPSTIVPGHRAGADTLSASVNAFSRMWFGTRDASELAVTTDLDAPPRLLAALDRAIRLPLPKPGWDF